MAPTSDYTSATGGALKLKGSSSSSGIDKHRKKKKKKDASASTTTALSTTNTSTADVSATNTKHDRHAEGSDAEGGEVVEKRTEEREQSSSGKDVGAGMTERVKTEAEIRFEERRRRRLDDRLRREGAKTHKERVEDLNRYLSNLSEHHDMPRIGPG